MTFSSIPFLFYFLPFFLVAYFLLPFKNTVLLIFSLIFYAWGELSYILIMLFSIVLNYSFGLLIARYQRMWILATGIILNLTILFYFKYFNFLLSQITGQSEQSIGIHLPLGISFFTFQAISYLVDVKRRDANAEKNPLNLGLYIAMFPQLIAGPIVRFKSVSKQIHARVVDWSWVSKGLQLFVFGLAQKVLIANPLAKPVDQIFALPPDQLTTLTAWLGSICYTLQIFFDFAGYSNMAIGLGLMLGFTFPQNFNYPYISQSVTEFWRRWHISLSQWFRDYLYIPLGGNRKGTLRTYLNLFTVFVLCGLWHGAAWTFLIWGIYQGVFLIIERLGLGRVLENIPQIFRHTYLLLVVIAGWVIFRVDNLEQLQTYGSAMLGMNTTAVPGRLWCDYLNRHLLITMAAGILLSIPFHTAIKSRFASTNLWIRYSKECALLVIFVASLAHIASGSYNPFIYFRF